MDFSSPSPVRIRRSHSLKVYVIHDGELIGPQTWNEVRRHLVNGNYQLSDLTWCNRLENWVALEAFADARRQFSATKYEMPSPPDGSIRPRSRRGSRRSTSVAPTKRTEAEGIATRLFRRWFGSAPAAETEVLKSLKGGQLEGVSLAPGEIVNLFCRTLNGEMRTLRIPGMKAFRVERLSESNPIEQIHHYSAGNIPNTLLEQFGLPTPSQTSRLLHLHGGKGCELVILFDNTAEVESFIQRYTNDI